MVKRESRKWVEKVHRKSEFGTGVCELELWEKSSFFETLATEEGQLVAPQPLSGFHPSL